MKIKTKFNLYDLLKRKYQVDGENIVSVLEVMYIKTETCNAGTQVFYNCRQVQAEKEFEKEYDKKNSPFKWVVGYGLNANHNINATWIVFREDELIKAPKEDIKIIQGGK